MILLICTLLCVSSVSADDDPLQKFRELYASAGGAEAEGEFEKAIDFVEQALTIIPNHPYLHYYMAYCHANLGQEVEALALLEKSLVLGFDFGGELDEPLKALQSAPGFSRIQDLIEAMAIPVNNSTVAITIPQPDLIPEGMAYDPVEDCFYLSSINKCKIVKFNLKGEISDFTGEREDGLKPVLGMRVDAGRRHLWAASEVSVASNGFTEDDVGWSALYKYDLRNGSLLKRYVIHEKGVQHLFNDIAITTDGDVYVTDSECRAIYMVHHERDELELFIKDSGFLYPNGITMGPNDNTLYMASSREGIYRIDIKSRSYQLLTTAGVISQTGMDGIYYYRNSLVCVQNGMNRISRLHLDETGDSIVRLDLIETRNPHFIIPTTGAIAGDSFCYIANSQLSAFDDQGNLLPLDQLHDVVILKADL